MILLRIRCLVCVFLAAFSMGSYAQININGTLYAYGGDGGYDWYRPPMYSKAIPAGDSIKLQARFIWSSPAGFPVTVSDHAIVAFVQGSNSNWLNADMQPGDRNPIWRYGVGAHVSSFGLSLEFWFNPNENPLGSAYVWNSAYMCGHGVGPDAIKEPNLCLSSSNVNSSYITPLPAGWSITDGREYWVRIKISPSGGDWYLLEADLLDPSFPGMVVQTAKFGFMKSQYFPMSNMVDGVLARAPGSGANISFAALDYGF